MAAELAVARATRPTPRLPAAPGGLHSAALTTYRREPCSRRTPACRRRTDRSRSKRRDSSARTRPYAERLIGSIRRECLDHVIILNERHLRRVLSSYFQYHHDARTHLSLDKDCPHPRPVQPPSAGNIIAFPEVGGLHHRYERRAA